MVVMKEMLLDREGDAIAPKDYTVVTTEADFLRLALSRQPLFIRGARLCDWAEAFCYARGIVCTETYSFKRELQSAFPTLASSQIDFLAQRLEMKAEILSRPLTFWGILQSIYPVSLWTQAVSLRHAATWLVWLQQTAPDEKIHPLLIQACQSWENLAPISLRSVYSVYSTPAAQQLLDEWLGIVESERTWEEFPIEVPLAELERARKIWHRRIIESHGAFFKNFVNLKVPFSLKRVAAQETCQYYLLHADELSKDIIDQLSPYLSQAELNELHQYAAPSIPENIPASPDAVLAWFREQYLPYRQWQHRSDAAQGREVVLKSARQFADWYLNCYPKALSSSDPLWKWLSFNRSAQLAQTENLLTLLIVLDGLHAADARYLLNIIRSQTQRLTIVADDFAFAPLPTVTEFAKGALFRGVAPDKIDAVGDIGQVLPDNQSPAQRLQAIQQGLYLWRVQEPDSTYHQKNRSENLLLDVEGRLQAEALKIKQIVELVPDGVVMQIVIASDHGRLLGKSTRTLFAPQGLQIHGRAAWGNFSKVFPASGYLIEDNLVYLFSESFGLIHNTIIPLDESSFRMADERGGSELYPHGGLFPEEVIVPWIVLARDFVKPSVEISLSGSGKARRSGKLQVKVLNLGEVSLTIQDLVVNFRSGRPIELYLDESLKACSDWHKEIEIENWPAPLEVSSANAFARIRQPNGLVFEYQVEVSLESEDIYVRPDDILEDLE